MADTLIERLSNLQLFKNTVIFLFEEKRVPMSAQRMRICGRVTTYELYHQTSQRWENQEYIILSIATATSPLVILGVAKEL